MSEVLFDGVSDEVLVAEAKQLLAEANTIEKEAETMKERASREKWDVADRCYALSQRGWTQTKIGKAVGVSNQTVSVWTRMVPRYLGTGRPAFGEAYVEVFGSAGKDATYERHAAAFVQNGREGEIVGHGLRLLRPLGRDGGEPPPPSLDSSRNESSDAGEFVTDRLDSGQCALLDRDDPLPLLAELRGHVDGSGVKVAELRAESSGMADAELDGRTKILLAEKKQRVLRLQVAADQEKQAVKEALDAELEKRVASIQARLDATGLGDILQLVVENDYRGGGWVYVDLIPDGCRARERGEQRALEIIGRLEELTG